MKATADIYLDSRPKKNGEHSVKLRVTFKRTQRYYGTDVSLTPKDYEVVMNGRRRTKEQRDAFIKISHYLNKANEIIDKLNVFTFDRFKEAYLDERDINTSVSFAFDKYIEGLILENRLGTAESYTYAKNSLEGFKNNLEFADITPAFLRRYEKTMIDNGRSISTVGIYLRSLRTIYNNQNIDVSLYPFGSGKGCYTIPTSRNIKKALTLDEISKIFNYKAEPGTLEEMARDYWIFLYLCNGINVKDFCFLKWGDIDGNMLTYQREKTKRSNREGKKIEVSLKPEMLQVIKKWAIPSLSKDAYIFPHLRWGMTAEEEKRTYKQLTQVINKYTKRIAKAVGLEIDVTTYSARHSFATVLKRSGASTEMISELLGHSNLNVTESYLASFPKEQIQEQTNALTAGFNKANN